MGTIESPTFRTTERTVDITQYEEDPIPKISSFMHDTGLNDNKTMMEMSFRKNSVS